MILRIGGTKLQHSDFCLRLRENIELISEKLSYSDDLVVREFTVTFPNSRDKQCALLFFDGLTEGDTVAKEVLEPLMLAARNLSEPASVDLVTYLKKRLLTNGEISEAKDVADALLSIMSGNGLLLIDGIRSGLIINTKGWLPRGIASPPSEAIIRGPR